MSQVTDRDRAVLRFMAGWRHVTSAQVRRWLTIRPEVNPRGFAPILDTVRRRIRKMRAEGLVATEQPLLAGGLHHHRITRDGLNVIGLRDWRAPRFARTLAGHQAGVVDTALDALAQGATVVSEREARQDHRLMKQGRRGYVGWGIPMHHRAKRRGPHWPDFWRITNGDRPECREAVELELSSKDSGRLRDILRGFQVAGESGRVHRVVYLSNDPSVLRAVADQARSMGIPIEGQDDPSEVPPPVLTVEEWEPRHE